jgi:hypothetical protein
MKKNILYGALATTALSLLSMPATAQTQWIEDKLSDQCSAESRAIVAENTRNSIEAQVRRAEASIQEPASTADLSCMNDLMGANIDIFSQSWAGLSGFNIDGMINDIAGGLKSGLSLESLSSGVERAICDFASDTFSELTEGVTSGIDDLLDPSTVLDQMPDFTDGFSSINLPISSSTGSSSDIYDSNSITTTADSGSTSGSSSSSSSGSSSDTGTSGSGGSSDDSENIQSIWDVMTGGN